MSSKQEKGVNNDEDNATGGDNAGSVPVGPVGFIGLGQIGAPMARQMLAWPGGLVVNDISTAATAPFAEAGATVAATPADVASAARIISLIVRDDAQVDEVLTGPNGILSTANPGTIVAIHSTVSPDTPARLAELCEPHGVTIIDAPVSGGAMGAHSGRLALMVGGPADAVHAVREPFALMADLIVDMGPVGAGTRTKLARNLITFASFTATGEALALAEAAGLDIAKLGDVVRHSDAVTGGPGAVMLRNDAQPLTDDDGLRPIFEHTRGLGEKDLAAAIELGAQLGVEMPVARHALDSLGDALGVPHTDDQTPKADRPDVVSGATDGATTPPTDDVRERGKALMRSVYGWDFEPTKPFEIETVDHLFGRIWAQGEMTVKERRLLLIGLAIGGGQTDVASLQLGSAMQLDELSADDLRTIVTFLAYYAGWPRAAALNSEVEKIIARNSKSAQD